MRVTVGDIVEATGGVLRNGTPDTVVSSFINDSRRAEPGACFVAIEAERDGHDFVDSAVAAGATCLLVRRGGVSTSADVAVVEVPDTMAALAAVAAAVRRTHLGAATVVGVTGSTGKTSTKDLLVAALRERVRTHANVESFNNEIGLPLTLLGAPDDSEVVVAEMGARFAGNIADLCAIARPDIGVITNIGTAHAEHLGGPTGILRVKGELVEALPPHGLAVVPDDDTGTALAARTAAAVVRVGPSSTADVQVAVLGLDDDLHATVRIEGPWGRCETRLGLRGAHQAVNAAMAAAVARHCGVDLEAVATGLAAAHGSKWRMDLQRSPLGVLVINDAYNANPASMMAAIDALAAVGASGRRIAVLGAMRELGELSAEAHAAVGVRLVQRSIDMLVAVGADGEVIADAAVEAGGLATVERVPDADSATALLRSEIARGDVVLVKASRAVGLERVAEALLGLGEGHPS